MIINSCSCNYIWSILLFLLFQSCDLQPSPKLSDSTIHSSIHSNDTTKIEKKEIGSITDGEVNAIIEIPAGTSEKWELDKESGELKWETVNGKPRIVNYIGYPGNYGMVPGTLLPKEKGGDGDPLDILVLGPPVERGKLVNCKIIGILYLIDRGEQDDKLIAVSHDSPLFHINDIEELNREYNGITEILELWFTNYKGPGKMESNGFGNKKDAMELLRVAKEGNTLNQ